MRAAGRNASTPCLPSLLCKNCHAESPAQLSTRLLCACPCKPSRRPYAERAAGRKLFAEPHAPAPGPAGPEAPANLLFTVSAPRAVLTAGVLQLENVASEVLFHTERGDTGVFATGPAQLLFEIR